MQKATLTHTPPHIKQLDAIGLEMQKMHATNNSIQAHVQEEKRVLAKSLQEGAETRYQEVGVQIRMCMHNATTGIKSFVKMYAWMQDASCIHAYIFTRTHVRVCLYACVRNAQVVRQLEKKDAVLDKLRSVIARLQEENRSVTFCIRVCAGTGTNVSSVSGELSKYVSVPV